MAVRKVGRCRVTIGGRNFLWWVHGDGTSLRIASEDKRFAVAYQLYHPADNEPLVRVSGPEFPGVGREEKRPVYVLPPRFDHYYSVKGLARRIIQWSLRED